MLWLKHKKITVNPIRMTQSLQNNCENAIKIFLDITWNEITQLVRYLNKYESGYNM